MRQPAFALRVHNPTIRSRIKERYSAADLRELEAVLKPALEIRLTPGGFLKAAERAQGEDADAVDPTNYHAVWVRDSVWGYYGLLETEGAAGEAQRLLVSLLDYMTSLEQRDRALRLIEEPALRDGELGPMNVPHIRFDASAVDRGGAFRDVFVDGKPQFWNHKQNDALGLFLKASCDALVERRLPLAKMRPEHWQMLATLPAYLGAVDFPNMEDAGAWEEIERVNSSSVGIVVAALESFERALGDAATAPALRAGARAVGVREVTALAEDPKAVAALIERGYARLSGQLARGESPSYSSDNPRYRVSDAALLSLIYPARPRRLTPAQLAQVLDHVEPLVGEIGVKRYLGDTYQSAGYWQRYATADDVAAGTDDFSSEEDFVGRRKGFAEGSEAQWFFDSWISKAAGVLGELTGESHYKELQLCFFNRALGQVTAEKPVASADGSPVPALACPESYNMLLAPKGAAREFAPSPITPLNWAKASLRIALKALLAEAK